MSSENQHTEPVTSAEEKPARIETVQIAVSELDQWKAEAAKAAENWDKFLRNAAEFENFRKRAARDKDELARFTTERVIAALLPALDNLERALEHSDEGTPLHDGLLQVQKQFQRALADFGLVEIVAEPGDAFDPSLHEAVSHLPDTLQPDGRIIGQLQSGYRVGDRLLRPARVSVSKGAPSATNHTDSESLS